MWLLLAAASAACYGAADFCGGLAARRASVLSTIVASQLCGLALALVASPLVGPNQPRVPDLLWGAAAGLVGVVGLAVFYRALASTVIAIASPAAAVSGAAIPVLLGVLLGDRPSLWGWAGLAVALAAIAAFSLSGRGVHSGAASRRALLLGLLAGVGLAGFFVLIARSSPASGLWPLVVARVCSVTGLVVTSVLTRRPIRLEPGARLAACLAGLLDMGANILYIGASRVGLLALVVVVVSLYAAPTVLLARVVLRERLTAWRVAGLGLALCAVALMSLPGP
jgi:drug/metabolite transporter (DMT)-like permease